MPTFELIFIMKKMNNSALKVVLSRTAKYVLESGANMRKIENLGVRTPPEGVAGREKQAQYYLFEYDAGIEMNEDIKDKFKREKEVINARYFEKHRTPGGPLEMKKEIECNIYEDDLPPPERPNVLKLLEISKKYKNKHANKPFNYGTGRGINPF